MKLKVIVLVFFLFIYGCQQGPIFPTPTYTASPNQTSISRWMVYEKALSKAIVKTDTGLCEWEIWGRSNNDVYLWALCKVRGPIGTAGSVPVVIRLGKNGEITEVTIPRDGVNYPEDIRGLFPLSVQEKIFALEFAGAEAEEHIDERLLSDGPPMIAKAGTPLP